MDYFKILNKFYDGKEWSVINDGTSYSDIEWEDPTPKPSQAHLTSLWNDNQTQLVNEIAANNRAGAYPDTGQLIVALWEKVMEGRSESADELQTLRDAVKAQFPKMEVTDAE